jgi:hypothetical protein
VGDHESEQKVSFGPTTSGSCYQDADQPLCLSVVYSGELSEQHQKQHVFAYEVGKKKGAYEVISRPGKSFNQEA